MLSVISFKSNSLQCLVLTMRLEFRESLKPMSKVKTWILRECFTPGFTQFCKLWYWAYLLWKQLNSTFTNDLNRKYIFFKLIKFDRDEGQGKPRMKLGKPHILNATYQGRRSSAFWFWRRLLKDRCGGHLGLYVTRDHLNQLPFSHIWNLSSIGPVVSEKMF